MTTPTPPAKLIVTSRLSWEEECGTAAERERDEIRRITSMNMKTLSVRDGVTRRGQHPKQHGCVRANFDVLDDIPQEYRHGLFAAPRSWSAVVRLSNGSTYDDREPDAHGMAIKVQDVSGRKVLEESLDAMAQDFILTDHPVFFSKSLDEYLAFNEHFTKILDFRRNWGADFWRFVPRLVGFAEGVIALGLFHRVLLARARAFAGATPSSLLDINYWSATPYLLGDRPVKYMVRPADARVTAPPTTEDGLSEALRAQLLSGAATLIFGIHPQNDPTLQPIEDTTVNWHLHAEEFVPLARIKIPRQEVDISTSGGAFGEGMAFSPWHCLEDHRPIGSINRARKEVYQAMARARMKANCSGSQ